ncbi:MAG: hypothetical protein RR123_03790 [Clostridia bacterium]
MNCAVLVDLNSININFNIFLDVLDKVKKIATPTVYKFYNFSSKRHNDFTKFITSTNSTVALPMQNRKKVKMDLRQIMDAVALSCKESLDSICLLCSEIDSNILANYLKQKGKKTIRIVEGVTENCKEFDSVIKIDKTINLQIASSQKINLLRTNQAYVDFQNEPTNESEPTYESELINKKGIATNLAQGELINKKDIATNLAQSEPIAKNVKPKDMAQSEKEFLPFTKINTNGENEYMRQIYKKILNGIGDSSCITEQKVTEQLNKIIAKDYYTSTNNELDDILKKFNK